MATDDRVVVEFDQHAPEYRETYPAPAHELREQCPVAWSTKHEGFWVVTGHEELSALSKRADLLSNDHDPNHERNGYQGISIPERGETRGGFIEMDPPEQSEYRRVLNPFLSPAAVGQWARLIADFTRACIDDVIETGRLDFVDDFANVVPAVLTMAMLGLPLADWEIYCEPAHMQVYTAPDSPNWGNTVLPILLCLAQVAALQFSITILRARDYTPRMERVARALQILEKGVHRLREEHLERRARGAAADDPAFHGVRERQIRQHAVARVEAEQIDEAVAGRRHAAKAQHHPLGLAGAAGGVDDRRHLIE
jgi:cytochrome P450